MIIAARDREIFKRNRWVGTPAISVRAQVDWCANKKITMKDLYRGRGVNKTHKVMNCRMISKVWSALWNIQQTILSVTAHTALGMASQLGLACTRTKVAVGHLNRSPILHTTNYSYCLPSLKRNAKTWSSLLEAIDRSASWTVLASSVMAFSSFISLTYK